MKIPKIAHALSQIDDDLISEAAATPIQASKEENRSMKKWIKWTSVAASLTILIGAGAWILPKLTSNPKTIVGGIERNYKSIVSGTERAIEFPWEYKLIYEKFPTIRLDKREYHSRASAINEALLGDVIGSCTATGVDSYTNETHAEVFEVRLIKGIAQEQLVAVGMDGAYYVYFNSEQSKTPPATLGELLDLYALPTSLSLTKFSVNEGFREKGYYQITDNAYLWQVLSQCGEAKAYENADQWNRGDRNYLSFTATSESLGVYKKTFYVTEDGYISTNVFDYKYVYHIGEEKAKQIIDYAKNNATETAREQYQSTIAGTLTEIGDGYILVDDTVLCKKPKDGMVFKILTDDLQIRRYLECGSFKVGDTVAVHFQGDVTVGENNTIDGAVSMYRGTLINGNVAVPE